MSRTPVLTADQAAALIPDDAVVTVSSSSGLGCPDEVLAGLGRRFLRTQSPNGLTTARQVPLSLNDGATSQKDQS